MDEKFLILGSGLSMGVSRFFYSSAKRKVAGRKKGTVLLCTVKAGKAVTGEKIQLQFPNGKTLTDEISRIEVDKQGVSYACEGQEIGICLTKQTVKQIQAQLLN